MNTVAGHIIFMTRGQSIQTGFFCKCMLPFPVFHRWQWLH